MPTDSSTAKALTVIPSPGPGASLSRIVPRPVSSVMVTLFAGLEIVRLKVSVSSRILSSTVVTLNDTEVALAGKVTEEGPL